jgi:glycosyltransferase involved in cell wall biosynthesis
MAWGVKKRMDISVVVPVLIKTDKHLAMTMKCLELARANTKLPFSLIIVESGSQYLIDEADIYVHEKEISTPEIGHNIGFRIASRSDYIVLLTNDIYVSDGWLEALLQCFEKPDCGLSTLGSKRQGHAQEDKIIEDYWFDVAMIKKEIFNSGYYDERYNGSWPDSDLLVRSYIEGYKMYRNLNCVVGGEQPQSTVGLKKDHNINFQKGREIFIEKYKNCGLDIFLRLI